MSSDLHTLLNRYFLGIASKEEFDELEELIKNDPEARRAYIEYAGMDTELRSIALEGKEIAKPVKTRKKGTAKSRRVKRRKSSSLPILVFAAAAAALYIFINFKPGNTENNIVAVIHTGDAVWESSQSTAVGSELLPGVFKIMSGKTTLKFNSGADLDLKAPLEFEILSDMRVNLSKGSVSAYVRESAKGFRIDTPYGFAVDHGTRFTVNVLDDKTATFKVSDHLQTDSDP